MSNAVTRTHSGQRRYNSPPVRRHHQPLLLLQKQLHRADLEGSALCKANSASLCPGLNFSLTNLDRLMESVTPTVPAQCLPEPRSRGWITSEADIRPFFCLGDLWESFKECSVYGVGVPLLLSGGEAVKQYYVPSLSGIQLYVDPSSLRRHDEDSDAESLRETCSVGNSDFEMGKQAKGGVNGVWCQHNLMNSNSQGMQRLRLRDKALNYSSNNEIGISSSNGLLAYEYFEQEQPHQRKPLYDKVSTLASQFPEIKVYRSCDLLPESWVSVAWYPIYRIPMGPTLQNLDASFLTFHSLSTRARSKNQVHFDTLSGRKAYSMVASSKIALPVIGLASYKFRGSILTPSGTHEMLQANSLFQAAENWLQYLDVNLPDFEFFVSHIHNGGDKNGM